MRKVWPFVVSILIHLLIMLVVFSDFHISNQKPKHDEKRIEVTLLKPTPPSTVQQLANAEGTKNQQMNIDEKFCFGKDEHYTGIGIVVNPSMDSGLITEAPTFYPGYKAGMRVGDRIYDPYKAPDAHGVFHYTIQRPDFSRTIIHVRKEKICFRK